MRQVIGGSGLDTTAATQAWLAATRNPLIKRLILIGEAEDPRAIWLTDYEAPLLWPPLGTFRPAVVKCGNVTAKIGLDVQTLDVSLTPASQSTAGQRFASVPASIALAGVQQLARLHFYDNWRVRVWRVYMPTPGDCMTLGATEWFGGRVDNCEISREGVVFHVSNYAKVLTQKVPSTVIEVTNTLAATGAATLPPGDPSIPVFTCFAGSTETSIIADCLSPSAGKVYSGNLFAGGYMVFLAGANATLAGVWSAIGGNGLFNDGVGDHHSIFSIYTALPWPPTPGVDQFYVSTAPPINLGDEQYFGFPYVPNPASAA